MESNRLESLKNFSVQFPKEFQEKADEKELDLYFLILSFSESEKSKVSKKIKSFTVKSTILKSGVPGKLITEELTINKISLCYIFFLTELNKFEIQNHFSEYLVFLKSYDPPRPEIKPGSLPTRLSFKNSNRKGYLSLLFSGIQFALPLSGISELVSLPSKKVIERINKLYVNYNDSEIPLVDLNRVLKLEKPRLINVSRLVCVNLEKYCYFIAVDEIGEEVEVEALSPPSVFGNVGFLQGFIPLDSGKLLQVYDPLKLAKMAGIISEISIPEKNPIPNAKIYFQVSGKPFAMPLRSGMRVMNWDKRKEESFTGTFRIWRASQLLGTNSDSTLYGIYIPGENGFILLVENVYGISGYPEVEEISNPAYADFAQLARDFQKSP